MDYRDMTATEFKRTLGESLEQATRGRRIRITRHGRAGDRVVILRESELEALEAQTRSPLDALRADFDRMVELMQSPTARNAAAGVGTANQDELGEAAVQGFTARD